MNKFNVKPLSLAALVTLIAISPLSASHAAAEQTVDAVQARQDAFQSIEKLNKSTSSALKKSNVEWASVQQSSQQLTAHGETLLMSFDKGSEGGKAKADVWNKPEKFERLMLEMNQGYQELLQASLEQNKSAAQSGLDKANGTCRACHRSYRSRW
ncbi:cytochrome c [Vibrio sp. D404a]|uniref:c-type cytochrome n=1 Tax=unclassified Vibrio TaxID=2614977 RepID=UPI002556B33C|nr:MULTISPECIES: cytochrome c [unclassified Vibrio]MDK9737163.1 cytochrome c [Vibrio sp. D404a]MDK9799853.1 cytochrome c [Vibrio sp. D449a]